MKNINMSVKDDKLTIVIDLTQTHGLTKSEKSITVGTTQGNLSVPGREDIKISVNCYTPNKT